MRSASARACSPAGALTSTARSSAFVKSRRRWGRGVSREMRSEVRIRSSGRAVSMARTNARLGTDVALLSACIMCRGNLPALAAADSRSRAGGDYPDLNPHSRVRSPQEDVDGSLSSRSHISSQGWRAARLFDVGSYSYPMDTLAYSGSILCNSSRTRCLSSTAGLTQYSLNSCSVGLISGKSSLR